MSLCWRQMLQLHCIRKCVAILSNSSINLMTKSLSIPCCGLKPSCDSNPNDSAPNVYFNSQQPAINVLKDMKSFLDANPSEIITIFIEDYVTSPQGLTKVFKNSGLSNYMFPLSRMPKNGEDWPTVDDIVQKNQRLVVFTSKSSKEASEGIAYQWTYVVENQCELPLLVLSMKTCFTCTHFFRMLVCRPIMIICVNSRWRWWHEKWFLPKPGRITTNEHKI